jgi:hypothetical protein
MTDSVGGASRGSGLGPKTGRACEGTGCSARLPATATTCRSAGRLSVQRNVEVLHHSPHRFGNAGRHPPACQRTDQCKQHGCTCSRGRSRQWRTQRQSLLLLVASPAPQPPPKGPGLKAIALGNGRNAIALLHDSHDRPDNGRQPVALAAVAETGKQRNGPAARLAVVPLNPEGMERGTSIPTSFRP